jgi:hypothetical protein
MGDLLVPNQTLYQAELHPEIETSSMPHDGGSCQYRNQPSHAAERRFFDGFALHCGCGLKMFA